MMNKLAVQIVRDFINRKRLALQPDIMLDVHFSLVKDGNIQREWTQMDVEECVAFLAHDCGVEVDAAEEIGHIISRTLQSQAEVTRNALVEALTDGFRLILDERDLLPATDEDESEPL
jgi:hypothetical protein